MVFEMYTIQIQYERIVYKSKIRFHFISELYMREEAKVEIFSIVPHVNKFIYNYTLIYMYTLRRFKCVRKSHRASALAKLSHDA